jgi:hypothetical protein
MINKIICLLFCTLLIVTVFPTSGFSQQTGEIKDLITKSVSTEEVLKVLPTPPTPGDMSTPLHLPIIIKNVVSQPAITTVSDTNDVVLQMLEEIDELVILGYLENLTSFGPRVTGSGACVAAAQYIYNEFQSMGLDVRYDNWNFGGYSSSNVEAVLNGTDESSDEIYIICGHYDSVSGSPGADDDGSGVAATMAAAYVMSRYEFDHTIRFVAFSGEEQGLLGSRAYVIEAVTHGWNIKGVLNADMISYAVTQNDGNYLIVYEDAVSEWLYQLTNTVADEYSSYIELILVHGGYFWGSDHNSFWDHGYSSLFYFEYTETPYYHSPGDTIIHTNMTYAKKNARLIIATLAELAHPPVSNPPDIPTIIGPIIGAMNKDYTYIVNVTDPDGDHVYYYVDWGDETDSGWIGPYSSGTQISVTHIWDSSGEYNVRVKAKDVYDVMSKWSVILIVTIIIDNPPITPTITGSNSGKPSINYNYQLLTTDPESDAIYYYIDWGDSNIEDWFGPYDSGEKASAAHIWKEQGTYTIKAKAKDVYDLESDLATLTVTIPRNKIFERPFIQFMQNFLESHPNLFPILQKLIQRLEQ